jgi:valine dehydrogenase (NAD+)
MDVVARECDFVTGRTAEHGGAGDSSVLTAFGVFQGMRASAEARWGDSTLGGRTVGIAGVGKVGRHLAELLLEAGARVVVTDVFAPAVDALVARFPEVEVVADADALVTSDLDVYAPCALGGAIDDDVVLGLKAQVICGAANNQLAHRGIGDALAARDILYSPDFCVNSGGLIQVADELDGFSFERAKARAARIYDTTRRILDAARDAQITPVEAAERIAEERMQSIGGLRSLWLGRRG